MIKSPANALSANIFLCLAAVVALTVFLRMDAMAADGSEPVILPPAQVPTLGKSSEFKPQAQTNSASGTALPSKDTSPGVSAPNEQAATTAPVPLTPNSESRPVPQSPQSEAGTANPVTAQPLADVDPDTLGLLSPEAGGLGASMWENTPRAMVERLLPEMNLPTASPTLNSLARRLLLTAAAVPAGQSAQKRALTDIRLEKLLALGDVPEAWQLAMLAKPGRIDANTMRNVTEAELIGLDSKDLCAKVPEIMAGDKSEEWQKALLLCQLRSGDPKAAGLSLDVMREQQIRDDVFIMLASRALSGGASRLPRQLTPLRPVTLGVLRQINVPLPPELYARPDTVLIPELLLTKSEDDVVRIALAEKAGMKGIISAAQLAAVYNSATFKPEVLNNALGGNATGPANRALLYQTGAKEQAGPKRAEVTTKYIRAAEPLLLAGAGGQALAEQAASVPVNAESNAYAATMARLFALAGRPEKAREWIKLANEAAKAIPDVEKEMQFNWPLFVLSGLVTDTEYGAGVKVWLDEQLAGEDKDPGGAKLRRQRAGMTLMLFSAVGFAVPDDAWPRVMEASVEGKRVQLPPPVLLERLQSAGESIRKGETVLLSILLSGSGANETAPFVMIETVRALRLAGFTADALTLARETLIATQ